MTGRSTRLLITGASGMLGSALRMAAEALFELVLTPTSGQLDLRNRQAVAEYIARNRPDAVINAAVRSGGLMGQLARQADYLSDNLAMQANLIDAARLNEVPTLVNIATSRIYPVDVEQPIAETALFAGRPQAGLETYAAGKWAGIMHAEAVRLQDGLNYFTIVPCNLYGPRDHFASAEAHVIPMVMRRMHAAKLAGDKQVHRLRNGSRASRVPPCR